MRKCEICFSEDKEVLYTQKFNSDTISVVPEYDVVTCDNCGFCFADGDFTQKMFNNYYAKMSQYEFKNTDGEVPESYKKHNRKIVKFINSFIYDKNAKILEIGCSTGNLLSQLRGNGYKNLLGVDPSESCAETVKKKHGIWAIADTIDSLKLGEKYDLIILSSVVEHLLELNKSMKKIVSLLKPNGSIFIEVPDIKKFYDEVHVPFQNFSVEHINYFSEESLKNLLGNFNLYIEHLKEYHNKINQTSDPCLFVMASNKYKYTGNDVFFAKAYINKCKELDNRVKKSIKSKLKKVDVCIVWCVGTPTMRLLGDVLKYDKIAYFVDDNENYWGKNINGIPIISPKDIDADYPILVSTYSHRDKIVNKIKDELKLKNEVIIAYE